MNKVTILLLVFCITMPSIGFAGAVSSRFDIAVGGQIKFDVGYVDQNQDSSFYSSRRKGDDSNYKNGNFTTNASETSLMFFLKGPEAFGAKTSAMIHGDFTGDRADTNNGVFALQQAKIEFDWANTRLELGSMGTLLGQNPMIFTGNSIAHGYGIMWNKGYPAANQVTLTQRFGKNFSAAFGIIEDQHAFGGTAANSKNSTWTNAGYPGVQGYLQFQSDVCGRIGMFPLTIRLGGEYARERINDAPAGSDSYYNGYYTELMVVVPIIPEKQGHKKNSLMFSGTAYQMQNANVYGPAPTKHTTTLLSGSSVPEYFWAGRYTRPDGSYAAPVINGFQTNLRYYFTDKLFSNIWYAVTQSRQSRWVSENIYTMTGSSHIPVYLTGATQGGIVKNQWISVNLMYDLNDAVRFGLEWDNVKTRYGKMLAGYSREGTLNSFRFGAFYFF